MAAASDDPAEETIFPYYAQVALRNFIFTIYFSSVNKKISIPF
jgi:hypothetical protein